MYSFATGVFGSCEVFYMNLMCVIFKK